MKTTKACPHCGVSSRIHPVDADTCALFGSVKIGEGFAVNLADGTFDGGDCPFIYPIERLPELLRRVGEDMTVVRVEIREIVRKPKKAVKK